MGVDRLYPSKIVMAQCCDLQLTSSKSGLGPQQLVTKGNSLPFGLVALFVFNVELKGPRIKLQISYLPKFQILSRIHGLVKTQSQLQISFIVASCGVYFTRF